MSNQSLISIPKIELHCHLDGSIRPMTALALAKERGLLQEDTSLETVEHLLQAPTNCDSLDTYLKTFDLPIAMMQDKESIKRVAYELFEDAYRDGVCYMEVRFAPLLHIRKGLTIEQVLEAALEGMQTATEQYDITGNYILSHLRHHSPELMFELINAGLPFLRAGVVAVDLAGSELEGYARRFVEPVQYARDKGYAVTMHAGETGFISNIVDAIKLLGASRIGHGVALKNDEQIMKWVIAQGVTIEACPTSNLQTRIVASPDQHPVDYFHQMGVKVMLNTDNRTVSQTTLTNEYNLIQETFGWGQKDFEEIYKSAVSAAFCDPIEKQRLLLKLR